MIMTTPQTHFKSVYEEQVSSIVDFFCNDMDLLISTPTDEAIREIKYTQWHVPGIRDDDDLETLIEQIKSETK